MERLPNTTGFSCKSCDHRSVSFDDVESGRHLRLNVPNWWRWTDSVTLHVQLRRFTPKQQLVFIRETFRQVDCESRLLDLIIIIRPLGSWRSSQQKERNKVDRKEDEVDSQDRDTAHRVQKPTVTYYNFIYRNKLVFTQTTIFPWK